MQQCRIATAIQRWSDGLGSIPPIFFGTTQMLFLRGFHLNFPRACMNIRSSATPMRASQHGTWNEQTKASLASGATEAQRLDCSTCSTKFIESGVGVQFRFSCAEQKELNRIYTRLALQGSTYTICSSISISVSCMPVFWDFFYQGIFMYDGNKKNRDWNLCPPTNKVIRRVKQPKIVTEIYVLQRIKLSIANKNIYKNT
jgi:hypothetical protein